MPTQETPALCLEEIVHRLYCRLEFLLYAVAIETDDHNEPGRVYWEGLRLLLDESVDDIQCLRKAPFPIASWRTGQSKEDVDAQLREYLQRQEQKADEPNGKKIQLVDEAVRPPPSSTTVRDTR